MSGPMATCAEVLSEFTHDLRPGAIPREVRENVSLRVLDILGIALASTAQDFAPAVLGVVEAWGSGECTVIGTKLRAAPPMAILANGSLAHGLDYDDTHTVAICHASAVVVPTALALGESLGLDGAAVLAAMVAGYETMTRIGMAAPGEFHARGWHATAVCGTFAAALVAGKCLGLSRAPLPPALRLGGGGGDGGGCLKAVPVLSLQPRLHGLRGPAQARARAHARRDRGRGVPGAGRRSAHRVGGARRQAPAPDALRRPVQPGLLGGGRPDGRGGRGGHLFSGADQARAPAGAGPGGAPRRPPAA